MTDTDVAPAVPAGTSKTTTSARRRAWTVTALLVVFMMINFADKSVLGLAAEEIREDLGLTASAFGLASSAFFLLFSISGAAVGLLADRVRPKWLLLAMAVLGPCPRHRLRSGEGSRCSSPHAFSSALPRGLAFPVAQQATLSWFPDRRRNLPGALIVLGITLGVLVAAPVLTWVIQNHGWRSAVAAVALVGVVWALLWVRLGGEGPYATAPTRSGDVRSEGTSAADATTGPAPRRTPYRRISRPVPGSAPRPPTSAPTGSSPSPSSGSPRICRTRWAIPRPDRPRC